MSQKSGCMPRNVTERRTAKPDSLYMKEASCCAITSPPVAKSYKSETADQFISLLIYRGGYRTLRSLLTRQYQGSANAKIPLSAVSPTSKNDETGAPV